MIKLLEFNANPYIGLLSAATDSFAVLSPTVEDEKAKEVKRILGVPLVKTSVGGSRLVGALLAANSRGAVVSYIVEEAELKELEDVTNVLVLEDRFNAAGNNILVNDRGALVHPRISRKWLKKIEDTLNVPVKQGYIADIPTVGSAAAVSNRGGLAHPEADEGELESLEELFGVKFYRGTANYGSGFIGASVVVNSKGAVAGANTTNVEISRIEDAFSLL